jgi:RNA polymerase sigma-70 factor (ECF subfamily)
MEGSVLLHQNTRMPEPTGPDWVALAQRGDVDAIGALYDQHYLAIFRYFGSRVGDRQLAEDLTADVFKRMLAGLPHYRSRGLPFRAWLFRIAHNLLVDHYRKESGRLSVTLQETESQNASEADPASVVEHKLTLERACHALSTLDRLQREVLALRFLSSLSLREVALALGKSEDAVKALQRRGLAALRLAFGQAETQVDR